MALVASQSLFARFSRAVARFAGRPSTFLVAVLLIVGWGLTGPLFNYSDTWQLAVNTTTTIITFLMVFLIQGSQNRDSEAIQIKLDELIRSTQGAHNSLLDLEELDERELDQICARYKDLAKRARAGMGKGDTDTGVGEVEEREH